MNSIKPFVQRVLLCFLLIALTHSVRAGEITMEGNYQLKNIFVMNASASIGQGFCISEILVNGLPIKDDFNVLSFEIDLSIYKMNHGDPVRVIIKHQDGCTPKILNPGALKPIPTFTIVDIQCTNSGLLKWSTTGEKGGIPFIIQQYKWNRWVALGEVFGKGTDGLNEYQFQTTLHSGLNKLRVVQYGSDEEPRKSLSCQANNSIDPIAMRYDKKQKTVFLTYPTSYELYDAYGQMIKNGTADKIDCSTMPKGDYLLNFDNSIQKFYRK